MIFDVSRPVTARELFRLDPVEPKQGKPDFMNLRALRRPGRPITKEQLIGAGEQETPDHNNETEDVGAEFEAVDPQEQRFRDKLSPDCDAFVDELDELLPVGIELKFMKKPGFRLHQEPGHHVLVMVSPRSGGLVAKVGASISIAHTLGFRDAELNNDGKWVDFTIDPAAHQPSALLTLAGAAMKGKRG